MRLEAQAPISKLSNAKKLFPGQSAPDLFHDLWIFVVEMENRLADNFTGPKAELFEGPSF
jgi:hypothetical protein